MAQHRVIEQPTHRELSSFLSEARRRIPIEARSLGPFVRLASRVGKAVTQEEIAEAAGISRNWYLRLETVKGLRVSVDVLRRIADVLMLNDSERAAMFQLSLPELRSLKTGSYEVLEAFRPLRCLARRLTTVTSIEEAAEAATETIQELLSPSCFSCVSFLPGHNRRVVATGPKAAFANSDFADTCIAAHYPNRYGHTTLNEDRPCREETPRDGAFVSGWRTTDGGSFLVTASNSSGAENLPEPPRRPGGLHDLNLSAAVYWGWNAKVKSRSSLTHGVFANGVYHGNLCALWTEPHTMSSFEIETIETACALIELAARPTLLVAANLHSSTAQPLAT